jgi:RNA polymerase sigma-70 factor (ECF subfamily)
MPDQDWDRLINGLRSGDQRVIHDFYGQYGALMETVADKHLAQGLRRRIGPDDVVQSACRTFLRRAKGGEFQIADAGDLWRLLCTITLTKVREQARFHSRKRRGQSREVPLAPPDGSMSGFGPASSAPSPDEVAAFDEQFGQLMASMSKEERQLVQLKLDNCTNDEAAEKLGCSERTVRRLLQQIRLRL